MEKEKISHNTLIEAGNTKNEYGIYEYTRDDGYGTIQLSRDNGGHWNCKILSSKIVCEIKNVVYLDDLHEQIEKLIFPDIEEAEIIFYRYQC